MCTYTYHSLSLSLSLFLSLSLPLSLSFSIYLSLLTLLIEKEPIDIVDSRRDLLAVIDNNLTWHDHSNSFSKNLSRRVHVSTVQSQTLSKFATFACKKIFLQAFIISVLTMLVMVVCYLIQPVKMH